MSANEEEKYRAKELLQWPPVFVSPDGTKTVRYTLEQWEVLVKVVLGSIPRLEALITILGTQSAS